MGKIYWEKATDKKRVCSFTPYLLFKMTRYYKKDEWREFRWVRSDESFKDRLPGQVHAWALSHSSRVWLSATPWTAAHQAPPTMGFSRQEDWSGCHCLLQHPIGWHNRLKPLYRSTERQKHSNHYCHSYWLIKFESSFMLLYFYICLILEDNVVKLENHKLC